MPPGKPLSLDTYTRWQHAIRCWAAVDDVYSIYDDFSHPDTPLVVRGLCLQTLRQWLAWGRDQDHKLFEDLRSFHKTSVMKGKIIGLLHGISREDERKPATYQLLIDGLNNDVLPIRTLSHWHLLNLAPQGDKIAYDPAWPRDRRDQAIRQWQKLIPPGQLPSTGAPPPKK